MERMRKADVVAIANGIGEKENREVLKLVSGNDIVRGALGVHPTEDLKNVDEEIEFIEKNSDKIVAIGEVGLDFLEKDNKEEQKKVFGKFIELSKKLDKPIIVHSRKAEKECVEILEKFGATKVVMHCFSGRKSLIDKIKENGWSFSIPASVKYNEHFQNLVQRVDISQLLCETDSPFLHPERGEKNEPALVVEGYKKISEIKKISLEKVEELIEKNYKKMFG